MYAAENNGNARRAAIGLLRLIISAACAIGVMLSPFAQKETFAARDAQLYAKWSPKTYTLAFDANGGSVATASKSVTFGTAYGELPVPSRTSYRFGGWYTAKSGGSPVTSQTVMSTEGATVYARWLSPATLKLRTDDSDHPDLFRIFSWIEVNNVTYKAPATIAVYPGDVVRASASKKDNLVVGDTTYSNSYGLEFVIGDGDVEMKGAYLFSMSGGVTRVIINGPYSGMKSWNIPMPEYIEEELGH